jgi:hypothetical protein
MWTELLGHPVWQGIGVLSAILLGFIGFYYAQRQTFWLFLAAATGLIIIGVGLGLFLNEQTGSRGSLSSSELEQPVTYAVDSKDKWQDTGVLVENGQYVTIVVTKGNWTWWREEFPSEVREQIPEELRDDIRIDTWMNMWSENDGRGYRDRECEHENCPVIDGAAGALVARIGNSMYVIGNSCNFLAVSSGSLFLTINDNQDRLEDNYGVLGVEIRVQNDPDPNIINFQGCGAT